MTGLHFFRHGSYVRPEYATTPDNPASGPGNSTDAERPDGMAAGLVTRYSKSARAHEKTICLDLIKAQYANAIEYTGSPPRLRGLPLLSGVVGLAFCNWVGIYRWDADVNSVSHNILDSIATIFPALFIVIGVLMFVWAARLELFCPVDFPIIFDRKHRKVFRIFRETRPGLKGMFTPWPLHCAEFDWDLIDAEHHATAMTTGSTIMRYNSLIFLVRKSASDPTIIDSFNIGSSAELGELLVSPLWEHIRRFMEEDGPALPPSASVSQEPPPAGFLESMGAVSPFGPDYVLWWKQQLPFMVLIHVLFPFFVPFFLLWGSLNWLSYKTATPIKWPKQVLTAIAP
jgi:hypothetical protein